MSIGSDLRPVGDLASLSNASTARTRPLAVCSQRRAGWLVGMLGVACLAWSTPTAAQIQFVETGPFDLPADVQHLHPVDLNSDGHLDLIVHPGLSTVLRFAIGDGTGAFTLSPLTLDVGFGVSALATGDLDGDQDPDLVVGSLGQPIVAHYENVGGGFVLAQTIDPGALPGALLIEDFSGDGIRDLVIVRSAGMTTSPSLGLYVNNGAAAFAPPVHFPVGNNPIQAVAGHLNGDALLDVLVAAAGIHFQDLGEVSVLIANGPGSFAPTISTGPQHPVQLVIADLAGSAAVDLALVDSTAAFGCGLAGVIWTGDGTGAFQVGQPLDFPCGPFAMRAADFDLDGVNDLLLTDGGDFIPAANFFQVARRNAQGAMEVQVDIFGSSAYSLATPALGDFNEDGRIDVALGGFNGGLSVFLNQPGTPPTPRFQRGDTNEDAAFNIADPVRLLSVLFVPGTAPLTCADSGDGNDDGMLNIADAVTLLSAIFVPGTPPPAAPFPDCGDDPTPDALPDCTQQPAGC